MILRWNEDPTFALCALRSYRSGNNYLLDEVSHHSFPVARTSLYRFILDLKLRFPR